MAWVDELKNNIQTVEDLRAHIPIADTQVEDIRRIVQLHPMSVTRYYMSLIDKENPGDPLMKMINPTVCELNLDGSYDTSGEEENTVLPGVQHKYASTVLITTTNQCAAYCRYCFRKRVVGHGELDVVSIVRSSLEYLRNHPEVYNLLISGGDPLTLPTESLRAILEELRSVDTLLFIRFGTKTPVVLPQRITEDPDLVRLLADFSSQQRQIYIVTHFNHPRELSPEAVAAVTMLREAGLVVNNQTVLMRGVNDDPEVLAELMRRCVSHGINPYYVFQCRPVKRVKKHFQLPLSEGLEIVEQAKVALDGHAKRFKYIMSHLTGKVEIVGRIGDEIYLKYHQAKDAVNVGRFFKRRLTPNAGWLDELEI